MASASRARRFPIERTAEDLTRFCAEAPPVNLLFLD